MKEQAYSLLHIEESKQLLLKFRSINNLDELLRCCSDEGCSIGSGELSHSVSKTIEALSTPTNGRCEMFGKWRNEDFFIGEILRLNLKQQGYIEAIKIDKNRWWLTTVKCDNLVHLTAQYVIFNDVIGADTLLEINSNHIEVESVEYIVATDLLRTLDKVVFPTFYCTSIPDDLNIEEILIIPLYDEIRGCKNELNFRKWEQLVLPAFKRGLDYKTVWYVTSATFTHYKKMYI